MKCWCLYLLLYYLILSYTSELFTNGMRSCEVSHYKYIFGNFSYSSNWFTFIWNKTFLRIFQRNDNLDSIVRTITIFHCWLSTHHFFEHKTHTRPVCNSPKMYMANNNCSQLNDYCILTNTVYGRQYKRNMTCICYTFIVIVAVAIIVIVYADTAELARIH